MDTVCSAVNPMTILWSVVILFVLALVFGVVLAVLGKKLAVHEDERIGQVREKLSGANCGGCGYAGCDAFAKAVVEGKADVNACSATSAENKKLIGEIIGASVSAQDTIIVVACNGGHNAQDKYEYMGYGDCRSMELLGGGRKICKWGCLGMGSCTDACPTGAVQVGMKGYAEIDEEKCIKCGRCVTACPKKLTRRIPASAKVYVACSNCQTGKEVRAICKSGCIGCGLCKKNCPSGAIEVQNNLAVIDYSKCTGCGLCAEKCPQKCIARTE